MTNRKIIVIGYRPGELLPPYDQIKKEERIIPSENIKKQEAQRILDYIKGKDAITAPVSIHLGNYNGYFNGDLLKKVEVVGSWLELCVINTMDFFLKIGSEVFANPEYLLSKKIKRNSKKESFLKENLLIPSHYQRTMRKTSKGLVFKQTRILTRI